MRAIIKLQTPDGQIHTVEDESEYYTAPEYLEFMWRGRNYSCDCNRRLFIGRLTDPNYDEPDDAPCGDTIKLLSLEVTE